MGFKTKPSIKSSILVSFILLFSISTGSIIFHSQWIGHKQLQEYTDSRVLNASKNIISQLIHYLEPVLNVVQYNAKIQNKEKGADFIRDPFFLKQQMSILDAAPQIQLCCSAVENNSFLCVLALDRTKEEYRYQYTPNTVLPQDVHFKVEFLDRSSLPFVHTITYYSAAQEIIGEERKTKTTFNYTPVDRPWYIGAKDAMDGFWTPPYLYARTSDVGITASYPVVGKKGEFNGVISANITLDNLGEFLEKNLISPNSTSFIINKKGEIISYQKGRERKTREPRVGLHSILEAAEPQVREAYDVYSIQKQNRFSFSFEGVEYIAYFNPVDKDFGADWILGTVIPTDDLAGELKGELSAQLILSLVIFLLSGCFIFLIATRVSTPIKEMSDAMLRIGKLDFNFVLTVKTWFSEIQSMHQSLLNMKTGLQSFERYVPKVLVEHLVGSQKTAVLEGEKKQLTVFFSDIENFTTIVEKTPVEKIMLHLTEYLDELTKIIKEHQGTIDKYIGDSIMAFWGAPVDLKNHAQLACRVALLCQRRLQELNIVWEKEGKPLMNTRIGINTGEMIVGNLGSFERLNYTLLGDNVNLGARLEGANKFYGSRICISESTYEIIKEEFLCRILDQVAVKGKEKGIKIYEVLGEFSNPKLLPNATESALAHMSAEAFNQYLEQDWEKALASYTLMLVRFPDDSVTKMFIKRCKTYQKTPPPPHWNGIYTLTEK